MGARALLYPQVIVIDAKVVMISMTHTWKPHAASLRPCSLDSVLFFRCASHLYKRECPSVGPSVTLL